MSARFRVFAAEYAPARITILGRVHVDQRLRYHFVILCLNCEDGKGDRPRLISFSRCSGETYHERVARAGDIWNKCGWGRQSCTSLSQEMSITVT